MSPQWCVFFSSVLVALSFGGLTEACSCGPQHPQTAFCNSDVVIRGKIVGSEEANLENRTDGTGMWLRYEIKQTKMFKGFESVSDVQYLYTPHDGGLCGFEPSDATKQTEFLFSGMVTAGGRLTVTVCSFIQPWKKLSPAQRKGIMHTYKHNCDCRITPCNSIPCELSTEAECLWTDGLFSRGWDHVLARQYACVHQGDGTCSWAVQKPAQQASGLHGASNQ
ncbi:metalloproteinase inhibitor 4-like [Acipenser oxyrinchus oxyrinchus]|uniref:Metalloproteinase inhibitor 2 n=1 Tax=Acipenser oxyrinchus oxyrinchus TaxID=40147 RepID=A0AAD8FPJ1_ACIOX|nr:metalloproteinase inhibitor 4-like [Acipenser oxyrinchus oxyrinchus]